MTELQARDAKLIQYLNEAYGKEKELETALEAHITMALRDTYKKRLKDHLKETKGHARLLERRIKKLGGKAGPLTDVAQVAQTATKKAAALAQGPLHAARGLSPAEKQLKNAKTEYSEEHEEIANYTALETFAEAVGDKDTAKLARDIRRDEERMAKFLAGQISVMSKQVAREEIPAAQRKTR
jgi:ferritin-like metal-binding protein YciE